MAFHLKPKEEKFFALLDQHATLSYEAADLLRQAMNEEIPKEEALEKIDALTDEADALVMETLKRLQKTFITPMDREDIQQLIDQRRERSRPASGRSIPGSCASARISAPSRTRIRRS